MDNQNTMREAPQTLPNGQDLVLPWHLRLPARLEQEFREQFRDAAARLIPAASVLLLAVYGLALAIEHRMAPEVTLLSWRPRLLAVMATGAVLLISRRALPWLQPAIAAMALIVACVHIYLGLIVEHPLAAAYFYIPFLAVLALGSVFRVLLYWALPISLLILAGQAAALFGLSSLTTTESLIIFAFSSCGTLMSLFGQYFFERLQRRLFLSDRVLHLHRNELHAANRTLETQASEDGLTGTINRRGMDVRLSNLLHNMQHQARGAPDSVAVLLFDIDYFKQYNDTYGHQAGDECLKAVAEVPKAMVQRATDFVARYGGEEFVIVLGGTRLRDALVFAERMRSGIERLGIPHRNSGSNTVVTISIGVACTAPGIDTAEQLIQRADEALYQAKGQGRNRVACMDEEGVLRVLAP